MSFLSAINRCLSIGSHRNRRLRLRTTNGPPSSTRAQTSMNCTSVITSVLYQSLCKITKTSCIQPVGINNYASVQNSPDFLLPRCIVSWTLESTAPARVPKKIIGGRTHTSGLHVQTPQAYPLDYRRSSCRVFLAFFSLLSVF